MKYKAKESNNKKKSREEPAAGLFALIQHFNKSMPLEESNRTLCSARRFSATVGVFVLCVCAQRLDHDSVGSSALVHIKGQ